ncbi:hypothetical protein HK098_006079 [Nowakowskiella sp. JEL0407]|nr:hypothetical protein HK098_006079 [Nowakowskiella sp. JEL0407]
MEASVLQEKLARAVDHLKRLSHENEQLSLRVSSLATENSQLATDVAASKAQLAALHAQLAHSTTESTVLQERLRALESLAPPVPLSSVLPDSLLDTILLAFDSPPDPDTATNTTATTNESALADINSVHPILSKISSLKSQNAALSAETSAQKSTIQAHSDTIHSLQSQLATTTTEKNLLLEKINKMKLTLAPKLQAEISQSESLKSELSKLNLENEELHNLNQELDSKLKNFTIDMDNLKANNASVVSRLKSELHLLSEKNSETILQLNAEIQKKTVQLESLQSHLISLEESINLDQIKNEGIVNECKIELDRIKREKAEWESVAIEEKENLAALKEQLAEMIKDFEEMRKQMESLENENKVLKTSLTNLQGVLEQFQKSKDSEIEFATEGFKKQLEESTALIASYKSQITKLQSDLSTPPTPTSTTSSALPSDPAATIKNLTHEKLLLKSHLTEALAKIRELTMTQDLVDRKLITNLFVGFCAAPRGNRMKFEILQVIASVLKFDEEEKVKVGLIRKPWGILSPNMKPAEPPSGESFTDLWISFLLKETSPKESEASLQDIPSSPATPKLKNPTSLSKDNSVMLRDIKDSTAGLHRTESISGQSTSSSVNTSRRGSFFELMLGSNTSGVGTSVGGIEEKES